MKKTPTTKWIGFAAALGLILILNSASVYGQKASKRSGKNIPEATLKEAKVTATLTSNVFEIQPLKVRLYLLNPAAKRTTIGIRNYQNEVVFSDSFFGKEYLRNFDFSTTLSGVYKLRIDNTKEHIVRPFVIQEVISRNIVSTESNQAAPSNFLASIDQAEPAKIRIHLNNADGGKVEMLVRNEAGDIVYQGFDSGKQILKMLTMDALADGKYNLQVKNQAESITRNFEITSTKERSFAWLDKSGKPQKTDKATAFIK